MSDGQTCASLMSKLDGLCNVATSIEFPDRAGLTAAGKNLIFGRHRWQDCFAEISPDKLL